MSVLRRMSRMLGVGEAMTKINAGDRAPSFSVKGLDGREYVLDDLLHTGPVVAAFFKVSCPVCQFTFPYLERMYKLFGGNGVTFLGISQDDASSTKQFAHKYGITFPMAMDEKGYPASNAYGLTNVPTIFLIDQNGPVKVSSMGFDKYDLEKIASELADHKHMARAALFHPDEEVPSHRPG